MTEEPMRIPPLLSGPPSPEGPANKTEPPSDGKKYMRAYVIGAALGSFTALAAFTGAALVKKYMGQAKPTTVINNFFMPQPAAADRPQPTPQTQVPSSSADPEFQESRCPLGQPCTQEGARCELTDWRIVHVCKGGIWGLHLLIEPPTGISCVVGERCSPNSTDEILRIFGRFCDEETTRKPLICCDHKLIPRPSDGRCPEWM